MVETRTCPRCSSWFATEQVDGEFSGICPRCLAGLMMSNPGEPTLKVSTGSFNPPSLGAPETPLRPGDRFGGFEILDVLGQGGMGIVYRARQTSLARTVALKVLAPRVAGSDEFARRFDREAKVLASLNHPNVVQVHDFGRQGDVHYLVMEHVDGESLETAFKRGRPNPAWLLRVLRDVARGLERVHEAGLVHRDLKPANILIARDGTAKIGDFGLAVETRAVQSLTEHGYFVGTPYYVSPEHAKGEKVDGRADLYALGVILFEGFAGRTPFQAPTPTAVLAKHIETPAPSLLEFAPEAPPAVSAIVQRLLQKDPAKRFATARNLRVAIQAAMGAPKRKLPRKLLAAAAAGVIGCLLAVLLRPTPAAPDTVAPFLLSAVEALRAEKYDQAARHSREASARAGDDPAWGPQIAALAKRIEEQRTERVSLKGKTDDEEFGQFLCFSKGDWERGLPMIAAGEESPYRAIAQKDLSRPADSAGRITLAEGWLEAAGRAGKPRWAERMRERAWAWLSAARAGAAPSQREAIDRRLAELDAKLESRREIDLLRLANPEKFSVAGDFRLEDSRLKTPSSTAFARMSLPYLAPDEFDLDLAVERRSGDGPLYLGLPRPAGAAGIEIDGRRLPGGKAVRLSFRVRRDRIESAIDGATFVPSTPPPDRWRVPEPRLIVLGSDMSALWITKMSLRIAWSLPSPVAEPPTPIPGPWIDLLSLVRPEDHSIQGSWTRVAGVLVSPAAQGIPRIEVPFVPSGDFDLTVTAARGPQEGGFLVGLSHPQASFAAMFDNHPEQGYKSGFELIDGKWGAENESTRSGLVFPRGPGRPVTLEIAVRNGTVNVMADSRLLLQWKGDFSRLSYPANLVRNPKALHLACWGGAWTISAMRIRVAPAPVDLLRLIDPGKDGVKGEWSFAGKTLTCVPADPAVLRVPYVPPDEYELTATVERKDGGDALCLGLARGDAQFYLMIDGFSIRGGKTGLEMLDGKTLDQSPAAVPGMLLTNNKPAVVAVHVGREGVQATVDGKKVVEFHGDYSRLSNHPRFGLKDRRTLFLATWGTRFHITDLVLRPLSGRGELVREAARAPGINLLAQVDPDRHVVEGAWKIDAGALVSAPAFSSITIPYEPPAEYDLVLGVERKLKDEALVVVLPVGAGRQVAVTLDSFGKTSGLDSIDGRGMGFTERQGKALITDRDHEVRCSVRQSGVSVEVSGNRIIDWKGDLSRLSAPAHLRIPEPRGFFLGTWTTCRFSRMSLVEVTGRGRPLALAAPGGPIDLLALLDPARDGVKGTWTLRDGALVSPAVPEARIQFPVDAPLEYDLVVVVERRSEDQRSFHIGLPIGRRGVLVTLDGFGSDRCALENLDGKPSTGPGLDYRRQVFPEVGKPVTVRCKVRRGSLTVLAGEVAVLTWTGNPRRLELPGPWQGPRPKAPLLGAFRSEFHVRKVELVPVEPSGVDLLALIDPEADAVKGGFARTGTTLVTPDKEIWSRIRVPYVPPDEYDLEVTAVRKTGGDNLALGLVTGGRQAMFVVGGQSGKTGGLEMIDGLNFMLNPTRFDHAFLEIGRPFALEVSVRKTSVEASLDGVSVARWEGDPKRLSLHHEWRVPDESALFLCSHGSGFEVRSLRLFPKSGEGRRLR